MLPTASLTVAELFSGPFLFNIPVYQRPYSWGREQASQLLEDLLAAAGLEGGFEDDPSYFLGTILLMDSPGLETTRISTKISQREFDVVDGQQRLVTLTTLIAVLRDLETDSRKPLGKRVQPMIVAQNGSRFFRTERYRLHLSSSDRQLFESHIQQANRTLETPAGDNKKPPETTLLQVRDHFLFEMQKLTEGERLRLFTYVADRCHFVTIVSHDIDRAHRLFVVLNERGKKLQRNDILKADVLSRLPQDKIEWAVKAWDKVSFTLGNDFEDFFSYVRTIHRHTRPQIVSGVRAIVKEQGGAEPFLRNVFLPLADSYAAIRHCDDDAPVEIKRHLHHLNRLAGADWAPAAMLALKNWRDDPGRAIMLLSEIDRLAHVLRLLCLGTGKRVQRFADVVAALREGGPLSPQSAIFQLSREEVRNVAYHLKDLHRRSAKVCKLLLLRLSDEIGERTVEVAPDSYTIEHVLPQRPSATSEWRQWFPNADDRNRCTESLGNLVLITEKQNDKARNASFLAKKEIYGRSDPNIPLLAITRDVLECDGWRRFEIEAREERLVRLIESIWRIDLSPLRAGARGVAAAKAEPVSS